MIKILINECIQEVSSFNPIPSSLDQFQCCQGIEMLNKHRELASEISGALSIFEKNKVEFILGFSARAMTSGGLLPDIEFEYIAKQILNSVDQAKDKVDGFYFALHGAMQSPSYDDPEGWLLSEVVKRVGRQVPIVISLDLHGIITNKMCENMWAFSMLRTYPHVDFKENGASAANLLLKLIKTKNRPAIIDVPIPALVRGDELITETGLLGTYYKRTNAMIKNNPFVLNAGLMIGNPFTDVPELKSHVLAICENAESTKEIGQQCLEIAQDFWDNRNKLQANTISTSMRATC